MRRRPGNVEVRDDALWFVRFSPAPDLVDGAPPVENLSTFAGAVRPQKPMDFGTLRPLDAVFLARPRPAVWRGMAAFRDAPDPTDRFDTD
ncbi:MAG: hypothetical protein IPK26_13615, partial [Planctomycetes bacterium]|nr:hypothetical protein [Planctomycetota bacterium]